jgi:hypothetical protein
MQQAITTSSEENATNGSDAAVGELMPYAVAEEPNDNSVPPTTAEGESTTPADGNTLSTFYESEPGLVHKKGKKAKKTQSS